MLIIRIRGLKEFSQRRLRGTKTHTYTLFFNEETLHTRNLDRPVIACLYSTNNRLESDNIRLRSIRCGLTYRLHCRDDCMNDCIVREAAREFSSWKLGKTPKKEKNFRTYGVKQCNDFSVPETRVLRTPQHSREATASRKPAMP